MIINSTIFMYITKRPKLLINEFITDEANNRTCLLFLYNNIIFY